MLGYADRRRLNAIIRRGVRAGLSDIRDPTFTQMVEDDDNKPFRWTDVILIRTLSSSNPYPDQSFSSSVMPLVLFFSFVTILMTNRKSHTPFRLVSKSTTWMTLNGRYALAVAEKMRRLEPTTKI